MVSTALLNTPSFGIHSSSSRIPSTLKSSSGLRSNNELKLQCISKPVSPTTSRMSNIIISSNQNSPPHDGSHGDHHPPENAVLPLNIDRRQLFMATAFSIFTPPAFVSAAPVATPDLTTCKLADIANPPGVPGVSSQVLCCLLNSTQTAKTFVLPSEAPSQLRVRRPAHLVDEAYITKYNRAYELMKALPADDPRNFMRQADVHCAYCNNAYLQPGTNVNLQVHFSSLFFPWHRWFLYFHERILASLIDDPTFALPFWAWDDQQTGGNVMPTMFVSDSSSAIYDSKRNPSHLPPSINTLNFNPAATPPDDQIIQENLNEMYQSVVTATTPSLFLGGVFRAGDTAENPGIGGTLENAPHTAIHAWTGDSREVYGEDMGNFYSTARDPIFYAHHSNVDRLWNVWKSLGDQRVDLDDPDFLNAEFYFYDEQAELVKVTVQDALSSDLLGFTYEAMASDQEWINYTPPTTTASLASALAVDADAVPELGAATATTQSQSVGKKLLSSASRTPKAAREKGLEEVLVLEGVEVPRNVVTQLLVFINLPGANEKTPTNIAEYAGSFSSIPHLGMGGRANVRVADVRLAISDNIERLGITDLSKIVVTVVARGQEVADVPVKIKGIRMEYM